MVRWNLKKNDLVTCKDENNLSNQMWKKSDVKIQNGLWKQKWRSVKNKMMVNSNQMWKQKFDFFDLQFINFLWHCYYKLISL